MARSKAGPGGAYRGAQSHAPEGPPREGGLVDDLIRQFADPLAFYRELVQNSLDAGATRISVMLDWQPDDGGTLTAAVRDDGCGMDRDILENQLTVLFRSGKEGQEDKIGKFGVGFVSVLALSPTLVAVRTSRGEGHELILHLYPDQTYELFRAPSGAGKGTTVTLHVPVAEDAVDELMSGSEKALDRWCRHATIPIHFLATRAGRAEPQRERRIDRPLGFDDALVQVRVEERGTTVVAALTPQPGAYLGFFKRGLLLYETRADLLGDVSVVVQDSRLEHTLSRDNVRRDAAHDRAMRVARDVVERRLTARVGEAFDDLARGESALAPDTLLAAYQRAGLALPDRAVRLPLLSPIDGRTTTDARELTQRRAFRGEEPDALAAAAARDGHPIVDLRPADDRAHYAVLLAQLAGRPVPPVSSSFTYAEAFDASPAELAMLDVVADTLAELRRRPRASLVRLGGSQAGLPWITGRSDGRLPAALLGPEIARDPFASWRRPPLWINAEHPTVVAARRAAAVEPFLAGAILARAILVPAGVETDTDEEWIGLVATRLGEGA